MGFILFPPPFSTSSPSISPSHSYKAIHLSLQASLPGFHHWPVPSSNTLQDYCSEVSPPPHHTQRHHRRLYRLPSRPQKHPSLAKCDWLLRLPRAFRLLPPLLCTQNQPFFALFLFHYHN